MTTSPADLAREEADRVMDTVVYPAPRLYDWRAFNGDLARRDAIAALALSFWERGRDDAAGLLNDGEEIRGDEADLVVEDIVGRFVTRWKGGTLGGVPSMKAELRKVLRAALTATPPDKA